VTAVRITLAFPMVEVETARRPERCPECGGRKFHCHGKRERQVRDPRVAAVVVRQYQCGHCGKVVTVHPQGVSRAQQTARLVMLSVTLYALGLSYDKSQLVLSGLGIKLSKGKLWENVQEAGQQALAALGVAQRQRRRLRVLGADETEMKVKGEGITVGFVTDPQSGEIVGLDILAGRDQGQFTRWLKGYAKRHGAKVVVSDDLDAYRLAAQKLELEQQVCVAHVRKAVSRRLKKIEGHDEDKELIKRAIKALTPQSKKSLQAIHRRYRKHPPPKKGQQESTGYKLRMLTLDLLEKWEALTLHQRGHSAKDAFGRGTGPVAPVPATNNATENAIGRGGKIRYRAMRGFKAADSMLKTTALVAALGGVLQGVSYLKLFG
jgi:hypothetical protein